MKIEHNRDFFLYKSTMLVHANTRVVRFQRDVLLFRCAAFTQNGMTSANEASAKKAHSICIRHFCMHFAIRDLSANKKLLEFLSKSYFRKFPTATTSLNAETLVYVGHDSTQSVEESPVV